MKDGEEVFILAQIKA